MEKMIFEKNNSAENAGEFLGFVFSYFAFTTMLFFVLRFSGKLPKGWTYLCIMAVTLLIIGSGLLIKRLLK